MKFYTDITKHGANLFIREIEDGNDRFIKVKYQPELFVQVQSNKQTDWTSFDGKTKVESVRFNDIYEMAKFKKQYGDIPNYLHGNTDPVVQYIHENYDGSYNRGMVNGVYIDIEIMTRIKLPDGTFHDGGFPKASEARYPINAICMYEEKTKTYHQFGLQEWKRELAVFPEIAAKTAYHCCSTEEELLKGWISLMGSIKPHFISGWNIESFDIPYIVNRVTNVLGDEWASRISPWGIVSKSEINTKYGVEHMYRIVGIPTLDYLNLYKKHTFKARESYTLDYIAEVELGAHKLHFEGTHGSFYWDNPQEFYDYNARDVELVVRLDRKLKLTDLVMTIAHNAGVNWITTYSPVNTWDALIYADCYENHIAIPIQDKVKERDEYEGAYVFDPISGTMHKAIASFDFSSLYPSLNRSFNIGLDTMVDSNERTEIMNELKLVIKDSKLAECLVSETPYIEYVLENGLPKEITNVLARHNVSMTPNWQFFRRTESIFTRLQTRLFKNRKENKKLEFKNEHLAQDIMHELERRGYDISTLE